MTLRDHFRPPLAPRRHWNAFHNAWATAIAWDFNRRLPEGYYAEPNVHFGIEIDVAAWEDVNAVPTAASASATGAAGGRPSDPSIAWTPPAPTQTLPFTLITDIVEIAVFSASAGTELVGAVELISPAKKDRREHREAFVAKCRTYLQEGIGLVVVDIVTERKASLHAELMAATTSEARSADASLMTDLYAGAYRPVERDGETKLDIWLEELVLARPLPTVPLWLRGGPCLPVALDATYEQTCRELRLP